MALARHIAPATGAKMFGGSARTVFVELSLFDEVVDREKISLVVLDVFMRHSSSAFFNFSRRAKEF